MKFKIFILSILLCNSAFASNKLIEFIKTCGYGALIGGGIGVLTLAMEKQPNEHYANVAKGASLGFYAGIAYGIYETRNQSQINLHQDYSSQVMIVPKFEQARLDG